MKKTTDEPRSPGAEAAQASEPPRADYESTPLSRAEYIAAVVHLYRGELYRANSWRMRLDNTTNWAVITTAGLLSFSFGDENHSHWTLLMGIALITVFWGFEARRFRFADVWFVRVRKIEENFYGPILRRDPVSPEASWGELVAEDLFQPRFKIGRLYALRERLIRNYWAIFAVIIFTWVVKVVVHPSTEASWAAVRARLALAPDGGGWWIPLVYVGGFSAFIIGLALYRLQPEGAEHEHGAVRQ